MCKRIMIICIFFYIESLGVYIISTKSSQAYYSLDGIQFQKITIAFPGDPLFVTNNKIYKKLVYNDITNEFFAFGSWDGAFVDYISNTGFIVIGKPINTK